MINMAGTEMTSKSCEKNTPALSLGETSIAIGLFSLLVTVIANVYTFFPTKYGHLYDRLSAAKGNPGAEEYLYSFGICCLFFLAAFILCQIAPLFGVLIRDPKKIIKFFTFCFSGIKGAVSLFRKIKRKEAAWSDAWEVVKEFQYIQLLIAVFCLLFFWFALKTPWALALFLGAMSCVVAGRRTIDIPSRIVLTMFLLVVATLSFVTEYISDKNAYNITVTQAIDGVGELTPTQFNILGNRLIIDDGSGKLKSIPLNSPTLVINIEKKEKP